ncbi:rhodanese-like domain-containing protein [Conservatibacter flavescens]|uniref:Rhodanese-like domain-containing protein n=1 Tax=Conservatibacter flavescens TaxID=28161 RepID=A0A2M8S041_9PAST|nr:rhodanese-like domain-containing protein [Conservatibacter flavescens]PJG84484.1 rhodanese-like domain-containing protein [Conservatibacter flavescens]
MKKIVLILLSLGIAMPILAQTDTQNAAQVQIQKAAGVWIDVRSEEEFNAGHLQDAVNVPHEQIEAEISRIEPNKDAPINLYCRSGRRAESAMNVLKHLGYTNVTNHGGYEDLKKQGLR